MDKQYGSVEELNQEHNLAMEEFKVLMGSVTLALLLLLEVKDEPNRRVEVLCKLHKAMGVERPDVVASNADRSCIKSVAEGFNEKVQEFRGKYPESIIETLEPGLQFLEGLCSKAISKKRRPRIKNPARVRGMRIEGCAIA